MDKKMIGIIVAYTVVMASLLFVTFGIGWNPSGYEYSIEGDTMTIEQGLFSKNRETVNIEEKYSEALLFSAEISQERVQWKMDIIVIGLILPFLLLVLVPDRRPFREQVPAKWFIMIVVAAAALYAVYSGVAHAGNLEEIQRYADQLLEQTG